MGMVTYHVTDTSAVFFLSSVRLEIQETSKVSIIGTLRAESTSDWWIPMQSINNVKRISCDNDITQMNSRWVSVPW